MRAKTKIEIPNKSIVSKKSMPAKSSKLSKPVQFSITGLDTALVGKAVSAVLKCHNRVRESSSKKLILLGDGRPVQVQLTLLRTPGKSQPKPIQIIIPHPFYKIGLTGNGDSYDAEDPEICLIVKDQSKHRCMEMIEKFPDYMGCVKKVLTMGSLRKKYQSYERKRQLLSKYNMFMADDRILPMMSKALGKSFIQAKKLPIPIDLMRETAIPFAVQKALGATYMTVSTGTSISIRAGHTGMEERKLTANIIAIIKAVARKVPHSWANIQMIGVKTADTVSLPVYNKTPGALMKFTKVVGNKADSDVNVNYVKAIVNKRTQNESRDEQEQQKKGLKSPLVQALIKHKAKGERETSSESRKQAEPYHNKILAKRSSSPQPASSTKKKKKGETVEEKKEKKDFIASKKFKGAKAGFIFQMGQKGLGYYIDKNPVRDRNAMEAILRICGGRGRSSKIAKQSGRRR